MATISSWSSSFHLEAENKHNFAAIFMVKPFLSRPPRTLGHFSVSTISLPPLFFATDITNLYHNKQICTIFYSSILTRLEPTFKEPQPLIDSFEKMRARRTPRRSTSRDRSPWRAWSSSWCTPPWTGPAWTCEYLQLASFYTTNYY